MDLSTALKFCRHAVGNNPERPWQHGVAIHNLSDHPQIVEVSATDGKRIARAYCDVLPHTITDHVILDAKETDAALKAGLPANATLINTDDALMVAGAEVATIRKISRDIPWPEGWRDRVPEGGGGCEFTIRGDTKHVHEATTAFKQAGIAQITVVAYGTGKPWKIMAADCTATVWMINHEPQ